MNLSDLQIDALKFRLKLDIKRGKLVLPDYIQPKQSGSSNGSTYESIFYINKDDLKYFFEGKIECIENFLRIYTGCDDCGSGGLGDKHEFYLRFSCKIY